MNFLVGRSSPFLIQTLDWVILLIVSERQKDNMELEKEENKKRQKE